MAYAQQFENDIFISYAHADNRDTLGEGWITLFHRCLEVRLQELTGVHKGPAAPAIWRDPKLAGNDEFGDLLVERAQRAALLVSVVSPTYVNQPWCEKEIKVFCDAAAKGLGLTVGAHKKRVIKVIKDVVERERHPEALQTQLGFPFYRIDDATKTPQPFTLLKGDENTASAKIVIDNLARAILDTLKAINEGLAGAKPAAPPAVAAVAVAAGPALPAAGAATPAAPGPMVYLAETHFSLDDVRQQVRNELTDRGCTVLPAGDLPVRNPKAFEDAVRQDLARCTLSIHMVGPERGLMLPGSTEDTVALQDRFAAERAPEGLFRLLWLPPDLAVSEGDPAQQAFVERLEREPLAAAAAELVRAPLHQLVEQIHATLERQRRAAEAPPPRPPDDNLLPVIYVISHPLDDALTQSLEDQLFGDGESCSILSSARDGSDEERADLHRKNMAACDAVLIVIGAASGAWKDAQLAEAIKAVQARGGRKVPIRVYVGPPVAELRPLRMAGVQQIDGRAGTATAALADLVVAARRAIADAGRAA